MALFGQIGGTRVPIKKLEAIIRQDRIEPVATTFTLKFYNDENLIQEIVRNKKWFNFFRTLHNYGYFSYISTIK